MGSVCRLLAVLGLAALLATVWGTAGPAHAAPDGSDTDRWRAHVGTDLGSWVRQTPWPRQPDAIATSRDYFGFIGFRRFRLGLGLGHGFGERFVAGLRLDYEISGGIARSLVPDGKARAISMAATPYITVMFDRKNVVRPFLSFRAGGGGGLLTVQDLSPLDRPSRSSSLLFPMVGVDLGAHAFVSPEVSLDGMVSVDHRWEYLRGQTPSSVPAGHAQFERDAGHQSFSRRFNTSLVLAVSRWF